MSLLRLRLAAVAFAIVAAIVAVYHSSDEVFPSEGLQSSDDDFSLLQAATSSKAARLSKEAPYMSPIAGCKGFDCIKRYVDLPDSSYNWHDTGIRLTGSGSVHDAPGDAKVNWTGYVLNMTSQTWKNPAKVSHPLWWHTILVIVPDNLLVKDWLTLELSFGYPDVRHPDVHVRVDNRNSVGHEVQTLGPAPPIPPVITFDEDDIDLANLKQAAQKVVYMATKTRALGASLLNLPNAYQIFGDDPSHSYRSADNLKGYAYGNFFQHPDEPERISELPMIKAVVRALDTLTAFTGSLPSGPASRFGVFGYSKLGTITWLAGAVDDRVKAIAPMAIQTQFSNMFTQPSPAEVQNLDPAKAEMLKAMTWAVSQTQTPKTRSMAYAFTMFQALRNTTSFKSFHNIMDPSAWFDKLDKPKLWIMGTSDDVVGGTMLGEYPVMLPDMPGDTRYYAVPNAGHDDVVYFSLPSSSAFFSGCIVGKSPPEVDFSKSSAGPLQVTAKMKSAHQPLTVHQWTHGGKLDKMGRCIGNWTQTQLQGSPSAGWTTAATSVDGERVFILMEYEWPSPGDRFSISTPVFCFPGCPKLEGPGAYFDAGGKLL